MLGGLVQVLVAPAVQTAAVHNMRLASEARTTAPGLTANELQNLKQRDPNNNKADKPKAYLNYVFFDKQLKFVEESSGVKQVNGEAGKLETLSSGKVVAKKNGYVYVYTSNESQQNVLFDNFGVLDITGPVLEETHYYPFGLTMSAISTTAPLRLEGKRKFNGIEFNHKEFSDGSGLDLYTAKFRGLDPQIGRWWQIDPKPTDMFSPYAAMEDNPVLKFDALGDTSWPIKNKWNEEMIQSYRDYAANAAEQYQNDGIKCTCEDFSLGVLINFAAENNLPLVIKNGSGTYSAASDKYTDTKSFKNAVLTTTAARDIQRKANTSRISLSSIKPGDLFALKQSNGLAHHIQLITNVNGNNVEIHQGNFANNQIFLRGLAKLTRFSANNPQSPFYIGTNIQTGNYNFKAGTYVRQGETNGTYGTGFSPVYPVPPTNNIVVHSIQQLNIEPRAWNFNSWNGH